MVYFQIQFFTSLLKDKFNSKGKIGAALYGVVRQGQDFFEASSLERATIIYNDMRLGVKSIGNIEINKKGKGDILAVEINLYKGCYQ